MQKTWMRQVTGLVTCIGLAAALVVGCSGDDHAEAPQSIAKQQCGGTVASMQGKVCTQAALECSVPISCYGNADFQPANCICSPMYYEDGTPAIIDGAHEHRFVCYDTDRRMLGEGEEPKCTREPVPNGPCPDAPAAAHMSDCSVLHQTCNYARNKCPGDDVGYFDTCACQLADDGKPKWSCTVRECPSPAQPGGSSSGGSSSGGSSSGGSSSGGDDDNGGGNGG